MPQLLMHIGKNGLTQSFLDELRMRFENIKVKHIKISVLKSARESKKDVKEYSEKIEKFLGPKFRTRVIGFSIFVKR